MAYYDWSKIVQKYEDNDLKRIYRDRNREPQEKVDAVVDELIKRGLLSTEKKELLKPKNERIIFDVEEVAGKTKANKKLSDFLVYAILVVVVCYAASIVSSIMQYELLIDIKNGEVFTKGVLLKNDNRVLIIGMVIIVAYLISAILFLVWFYTAYENLRKRINNLEYSDGWSIGAWFVPIISLFRPFNIMSELNKKTDLILENREIKVEPNRKSLIGLWWGLFVTHIIVRYSAINAGFDVTSIDYYIYSTIGAVLSAVYGIVLGYITIKMIKNIARKEEALFESERNAISIEK
jgi:Domain of unknown function (DUF4328)